jgi:hypothetical protein
VATGSAYVQRFAAGTEGRAAVVRYECEPAGMAAGVALDIVSVTEAPPLTYTLVVGTRDASVCAAAPSLARLLAPLNNSCLEHVEGWWTYEVCLGMRVRQFHSEGGGRSVQDSVIGVYDWAAGEQLARGLPEGGEGAPAIVQRYTHGTPCGIRDGVPREAVVRFECTPGAAGSGSGGGEGGIVAHTISLVSIREAPSCVYTLTFGTSLACGHPDVSPARGAVASQLPPTPIICLPLEGEGEAGGEEVGGEGGGEVGGERVAGEAEGAGGA